MLSPLDKTNISARMSLMYGYKIITNNPLVLTAHPETSENVDGGAEAVLVFVRDMIHKGSKLLNHPLSGGILPGISPCKSLVVSDSDEHDGFRTDFDSLRLIESALSALKHPPSDFMGYEEDILEDFHVLDLDMLNSALKSIN